MFRSFSGTSKCTRNTTNGTINQHISNIKIIKPFILNNLICSIFCHRYRRISCYHSDNSNTS